MDENERLRRERNELADRLVALELEVWRQMERLPKERVIHLAAAFSRVLEEGEGEGEGTQAAEQVSALYTNCVRVV